LPRLVRASGGGTLNQKLQDIMAITLTDRAIARLARYLAKRGQGVGVRLGVKTTGCSGMAYTLEYVDSIGEDDMVLEVPGVKVIIDPKSFVYLDGTELDFAREGLNEGFKFNNPNERDRCGCGESFRV
jgi:iron-sulfur cluster assembly protein